MEYSACGVQAEGVDDGAGWLLLCGDWDGLCWSEVEGCQLVGEVLGEVVGFVGEIVGFQECLREKKGIRIRQIKVILGFCEVRKSGSEDPNEVNMGLKWCGSRAGD